MPGLTRPLPSWSIGTLACVLAGAVALATPAPVRAADPFTDAMQRAYAPYRVALFRTNGGTPPEAAQALAQAQAAWAEVVDRHAARPPAPYDRDPGFAATLNAVGDVYVRADRQVRDGRLPQAHETLEGLRDLLAALRQRNQVVVYSDHMNAYHAEMEHVLTEGPVLLPAADGPMQLMARVGALEYLAARLDTEAGAAQRDSPDFARLVDAVQRSVADLKSALLAGDRGAAVAAIGKLKPPYAQLFVRFG